MQKHLRSLTSGKQEEFRRLALWKLLAFRRESCHGDIVEVTVSGSPATLATDVANNINENKGDLIVSAMLTPVTGFKFSVDYALNGNADGASEMKSYLRDGTKVNAGGNGIFGVAFDWDIAQSFDLGFDLGITASERYAFGTDAKDREVDGANVTYNALDSYNTFAAGVYGGYGVFSAGIEYALHIIDPKAGDDTMINYLYGQIGFDVLDSLNIKVYAGANDLEEVKDSFFIGGGIAYEDKGVTYGLDVEYARPEGTYSESMVNDHTGLTITPKISVTF